MCDGLIGACGRIRKTSSSSFEQQHSVVLSFQLPVVEFFLIIVHSWKIHEGVEMLRSNVKQKYWIDWLRSEIRRVKKDSFFVEQSKFQFCRAPDG